MAANYCIRCGAKLGFISRFSKASLCASCVQQEKKERAAAEERERARRSAALAEYNRTAHELWQGKLSFDSGSAVLTRITAENRLTPEDMDPICTQAFQEIAEEALQDDILTEQEEHRLMAIGDVLGIHQERFNREFRDLVYRLLIAQVNDGRLPRISPSDAGIILRRGESAHASFPAALLKEVAVREYQGGYSGFSFRIAKGIRYHTGGVRGRSVIVGRKVEQEDRGQLVLTSHRAVFVGERRNVEVGYAKLLNVEVFEDGVRFSVSTRKVPTLLRMANGEVVTAIVNAAAQKLVAD